MTVQEYKKLTQKNAPRSPALTDCLKAFFVGGSICALGQIIINTAVAAGIDRETAAFLCTLTLVFLSVLATGLGIYDKIAKHAGAGTLVPITGFANAIASPAMEFKTEGMILGLGANMFKIAGPVIVYGTVASVVYGLVYWIVQTL